MKKILIASILIILIGSCSQKKNNNIAGESFDSKKTEIKGENQKDGLYKTFENDDHKYGIMDEKGNIVIEPNYDGLEKRSDFYYLTHTDNKKDNFVWLDVQNKKLIILPKYAEYHLNIKYNIDVLYDNNQKMRVVQNGTKIIIPFISQSIQKFGKYVFANNVETSSVDLFDDALKKIDDHVALKDAILLSDQSKLIVVTDLKDKMGIMNFDLKLVVPFQYSSIIPYAFDDKYFIISKKNIEGKPLFGIMDDTFNIIIPLTYDFIDESDSAEKELDVTEGKSTISVLFTDFIRKK